MAPMVEISWPVAGAIASVVGGLLGLGVGWGVMRTAINSLKENIGKLQGVVDKVTTHDADLQHIKPSVASLLERMIRVEVDMATVKALLRKD